MTEMVHVTDELELFALDALSAPERARVAAHLAECPACREQARLLEEVAIALPNTLPQRDLPAALRGRVLASARADSACIEQPSQPAAEGARWYLRYDRAKGRKCWFLGDATTNARDIATPQGQTNAAAAPTLSSRLAELFGGFCRQLHFRHEPIANVFAVAEQFFDFRSEI